MAHEIVEGVMAEGYDVEMSFLHMMKEVKM